jgi:hypothetical protein
MAGEFGRAVSDLGAGLMARSERRRELEEQRKYAEEQSRREEEAFARKQKVLADIKAEQEEAKAAAKKAEELEKAQRGELNIGRDGEIIRKYADETGMPAFEVVRPGTPKQETPRWSGITQEIVDGKRMNVRYSPQGDRQVLGEAGASESSDRVRMDAASRLAAARQTVASLSSQNPVGKSAREERDKALTKAQAEVTRYQTTLEQLNSMYGTSGSEPAPAPVQRGLMGTIFGGFQDAFGRVREAGGDVGLAATQAAAEGAISPQSAADASSLANSGPARVSFTDPKTGKQVEASSNEGTVVQEVNLLWTELKRKYPDADPDKLYQIASKRVRGS